MKTNALPSGGETDSWMDSVVPPTPPFFMLPFNSIVALWLTGLSQIIQSPPAPLTSSQCTSPTLGLSEQAWGLLCFLPRKWSRCRKNGANKWCGVRHASGGGAVVLCLKKKRNKKYNNNLTYWKFSNGEIQHGNSTEGLKEKVRGVSLLQRSAQRSTPFTGWTTTTSSSLHCKISQFQIMELVK